MAINRRTFLGTATTSAAFAAAGGLFNPMNAEAKSKKANLWN